YVLFRVALKRVGGYQGIRPLWHETYLHKIVILTRDGGLLAVAIDRLRIGWFLGSFGDRCPYRLYKPQDVRECEKNCKTYSWRYKHWLYLRYDRSARLLFHGVPVFYAARLLHT